MTRPYDLLVVGLGAWGAAALYHAARRGLRVLGLDRFHPPHKVSAHHGRGRVIRMASPEAPDYTPMMARAYELWHRLERECGEALIRDVGGGCYVGRRDSEIVAGALASFAGTDLAHELLQPREARARFPWLTVADDETLLWEPGCAVIHPEQAIRAHLKGALAAGAEIATGEPLKGWSATPEQVTVETPRARYHAPAAILCLGAWAPEQLRIPALPIVPERQVVAIHDTRGLPAHRIFVAPCAEAECVYGLPEPGETYKVALHHGGRTGQPDALLDQPTAADLALIDSYVARRLPALAGRRVEAFTCLYSDSPDRHFLLDRHPDHANLVYGTGCSGRGFKFASVIGERLVRLARGEEAELGFFSRARFKR
jgi:sarcosine oxidase